MKKVPFLLLAAIVLGSCNTGLFDYRGYQGDGTIDNYGEKEPVPDVTLEEPETKEEAASIVFDKGEILKIDLPDRSKPNDPSTGDPDKEVGLEISQIDLSEAGRYVLYIDTKQTKADDGKKTIWMGRFSMDGDKYLLDGVGKVDISEGKFKLWKEIATKATYEDEPVALEASISPNAAAATTVAANLARNWKVESTYITVRRGNTSVSQNFKNGCDLHEIARYFQQKNVSLSDADIDQLAGYRITEINFIGNSNMIMNFDGPESYYGNWNVNGSSISWELNDSNRFFSAKATGTISFPSRGKAILIIDAAVSDGEEKYTGEIQLTLVQVN